MHKVFVTITLLLASLPVLSSDEVVQILGNESMPFNGIVDGRPAGMTYELLREAQAYGAPKFEFTFGLPWLRAQNMVLEAGDRPIAIVPLTRTADRESRYLWIENLITHYARLSSPDAGQLEAIQQDRSLPLGVIRGSALIPTVKKKGFNNFIEVDSALQNAKMLLSNRMFALVESRYVDTYNWIQAGGDVADLHFVPVGEPFHIYLAANPSFPVHLKEKIQAAFAAMKRDGRVEQILSKWEAQY